MAAYNIHKGLPLPAAENDREAVGRLMILGYEGQDFDPEIKNLIDQFRPAGLIFFKRNYQSLPHLVETLSAAKQYGQDLTGRPLLTAIDHEGGLVQRLPAPFTIAPSAQAVAESITPAEAYDLARQKGRELAAAGFNFNLSPVVDVRAPGSQFITSRSFSGDAATAAAYAAAYIKGYLDAGVLCCVKHFPGLGAAVADPHEELPVIPVDRAEMDRGDLGSFRASLAAGPTALMTTHALYPALDCGAPATFSPKIVDMVRREFDFSGPVLTDDLEMGAVVKNYPMGQAAVAAVAAGHDLALICRRASYAQECQSALIAALHDGRLDQERVEAAHRRLSGLLTVLDTIAKPAAEVAAWRGELYSRV